MTTQDTSERRKVRRRQSQARVRVRRGLAAIGLVLAGLVGFAAVALAALYFWVAVGPVNLAGYSRQIEASLAARLGAGWKVSVVDTMVELNGLMPAIRMTDLEIRNPVDIPVVRAPQAIVTLNPFPLLLGDVSPREIELRGLHVRGVIGRDGSLSFSAPSDAPAVPAPALPAGDGAVPPTRTATDENLPSLVSAAASSLVRPLVSPSGIIGALDRAKLVDARLSLVGADGRERAAFDDVDALFEKVEHSDRRFEIDLRGPRGAWRASGRVSGAKAHATSIEADGVPVTDVMLLAGLSHVPIRSDVKLSGSLTGSFARDRLARLEFRLRGSPGSIERDQAAPLRLDGVWADAVWDETARNLDLTRLRVRSEATEIDLDGRLSAENDGGWRLAAKGHDIAVADLDPARPPFRLASVEMAARFEEGRVALERLRLQGDRVDVTASGSYVPASLDEAFAARLDVGPSDARRIVRLWPDFINPELRSFLAMRLTGGTIERIALKAAFDQKDLKSAFSEQPFRSEALDLAFATTGTELAVVDGLPPLRDLVIQGSASGTSATLAATRGAVEMPDGRRLTFSNASYVHTGLDKPGTSAQIGFRIRGGLDALASFMRSPLIRSAGAPDVDPASLRGSVDLRASLPLASGPVPALTQLPIDVSGTLSDVAIEKLPGREKLEAGQFTVQQDKGTLVVRGEGRISGAPATIDLRMQRSGGGELVVNANLDEAARTRRSLPAAPTLAGLVGVRVVVPLGAKSVARVEADLTRATIDGLVPGWQKSAGKPGRIAFAVHEGAATELRDLVVDAGTVQMKGSLALSAGGAFERADLSSLKVSPGDDMRAQIERSGTTYRLTVRGNNADSRPLLKWMGAPPKGGGAAALDADIDLSLAILSGFNDEAMTGVSTKASLRGGELRSLQFGGKFRAAAVEASLAKRDAGAPVVSVRSGDAGATLRFLDLYRRMTGGRLALEARSGDGGQQGQITIDEFGLRGEPALRRIVSQSQQGVGTDDRGAAPVSRQDVDQVLFTRLTTGFRRAGSRIEYNDAVIYGAQVGFNLSGWVDTARDRLEISGTFVPAYLLNNAFSQLPVVGLILGGGRTEGLIAVDFRVAGALSGPAVTVNPLTAVAPGILRKLFGWMMPEGQAEPGGAAASNVGTQRSRRPHR